MLYVLAYLVKEILLYVIMSNCHSPFIVSSFKSLCEIYVLYYTLYVKLLFYTFASILKIKLIVKMLSLVFGKSFCKPISITCLA